MGRLLAAALLFALVACNKSSPTPSPDPTPPATASAAPAPTAEGALRLGSPIEASAQKVSLADVAKTPNEFVGKTFATTGTVTAVCQHMGCWMEIKDDASEAHIKMAGHAFFVPKTASGRKARILAKLEKSDAEPACEEGHHEGMATAGGKAGGGAVAHAGGAGVAGNGGNGGAATASPASPAPKKGCKAEAEAQLGHPLAKLELVAEGVELM